MKLYDYYRSSAAWRVRIALALKGLEAQRRPVHLLRNEHLHREFLARNPQGLVPALELDDGTILTQSIAIIEYLDAVAPDPPLLPADPAPAAKVRAVVQVVACDIHPLTNLRVARFLETQLGESAQSIEAWRRHWILKGGLEAVEELIEPGPYCFGATPTLADIVVIPQLYSARRFGASLAHLPKILSVETACEALPAFRAAHPLAQPDAE